MIARLSRIHFITSRAASLATAFLLVLAPIRFSTAGMLEITELLSHADQYDKQLVVVVGQVTDMRIATNREGQPAYGFLLKDVSGTVKVVGLGKADVRNGDQVIVEGIFSRLRQTGRAIIFNEIKASVIRSLDSLNPDLIG